MPKELSRPREIVCTGKVNYLYIGKPRTLRCVLSSRLVEFRHEVIETWCGQPARFVQYQIYQPSTASRARIMRLLDTLTRS